MSTDVRPKIGDRVRVILEGIVTDVDDITFDVNPADDFRGMGNSIYYDAEQVVSVEVLS